jgi:hypothetical protein
MKVTTRKGVIMSKYTVTIKPEGTGVFVNNAGEQIERVCVDVNGQDVQVIYYDGDPRRAVVFVGEKAASLPEREIVDFIESNIPETKP